GRVQELKAQGVHSILGSYSSSLSMPVSAAAQSRGLLYWEAGAVADQLTGRGYPLVFRVGATGTNLGELSSHFAAQVLAPRLSLPPWGLRMAIVHNLDGYPSSVAAAVASQAEREKIQVVANIVYDAHAPDWASTLAQVRIAQPNILVLASYIADGVDFRRAMLNSGLHVDAFIGSTMAQCVPDVGQRRRPQVRCDRRRDGAEHPRRGRDLAVAGHSPQRHRLSAGVRNRDRRLHPAAAVIQVRLAAPGRAARVTLLVLGAALLRALLLPAGDVFSTIVFAGCLLAITRMERDPPPRPSPAREEGDSPGFSTWAVLAGL